MQQTQNLMAGLDREQVKRRIAKTSPADFAGLVTKGTWTKAPHLALLNRKLLEVAKGRSSRLLITMPPRHGKSEFASKFFPAWYLGRNPHHRVILASYEAKFAASWGRKVRDLLELHGDRFFGVTIRKDSKAADQWETSHGGGMNTAGVGGPITGKGAELLIIDDPVKNSVEANSETFRERTWDWYTSTAYTRLEPGGAVILIQTRWHGDDLAGRILDRAKGTGERWDVVNLPALAEHDDPLERATGEPLWPARYDSPALQGIRETLGGYQFSALYQQRPQPAEGGLFQKGWFRYWRPIDGDTDALDLGQGRIVSKDGLLRFGTVDLAFSLKKEADFTVMAAWGLSQTGELVLLDLMRERMEGPAFVPAMKRLAQQHDLGYVGIEDVAGQIIVVQLARDAGLTIRNLKASVDKVTRAMPATVKFESGQVYIPARARWLAEYEDELLSFPRGAHDDMVDVTSYAAVEAQRSRYAVAPEAIMPTQPEVIDDERWWQ